MEFRLISKPGNSHTLLLLDQIDQCNQITHLTPQELAYLKNCLEQDQYLVAINQYERFVFVAFVKPKAQPWQTAEAIRKAATDAAANALKLRLTELTIVSLAAHPDCVYLAAEAIALANYQFLKYVTEAYKTQHTLQMIQLPSDQVQPETIARLRATVAAVYTARTWVNEPLNFLSAEQLAVEVTTALSNHSVNVAVHDKARLEREGMGGILAVNRGSVKPPVFIVAEYHPENPINERPIVLVGKGIVYDTGGLSLKPTPASMDRMKSDMSGAALVACCLKAAAELALPLHLIALIPATENRPGEDAYVPGDIIKMYSGATVEVLNTDAEGRLVLADALHWAKRYKPELVIDFATLTGSASQAIGEQGMVLMGTADAELKNRFTEAGLEQYERVVEFPLWDEYQDQIKSEIADLKNIGGPTAGAITAGKFLQSFTDYPWLHLDIAGVSFSTAKKGYIPSGGTAFGLRMLLSFLRNYPQTRA